MLVTATGPRHLAALAALCLALLVPDASALAAGTVPNTGPGSDPDAGFGHVEGAPHVLTDRLLDAPFDAGDADPSEAAAAGALWSPGTPENDLGAALDAMASAASASEAEDARRRAVDILEGNPIGKKAYSGIPLLNWNAGAKVKNVPAGGTVDITQVRWGEHMVSDTWLLEFADPDQPFKIRYHVAELGTAFGGQLNPTPLFSDGGGQHSAIQPLGIDPNMELGTHQGNRFTAGRNLGAVPEETRAAVQEVTVAMPPPRNVTAILDPNLRAGHEAATTLMPATAERRAALPAGKRAAIAALADASPEKQIWSALDGLPPQGDAGFLTAARTAGTQTRELVGAMRSRTELPAGVAADAGAQATVVLQNNEAYVTRHDMRLNPGESLRVQVVNRDGFAHTLTAYDLHRRDRIFGAWDWGSFDWNEAALEGGSRTLEPGAARTFTISPAGDAFAMWLGDLGSGDQANAVISLDRGIKQEALRFGATTAPVHSAPDPDGNVWVTLGGVDTIARIHPAARLADSTVERFPLPGGRHEVDSPVLPLAPADITVDGRGIVWATLASGNALARIDPARAHDGSSDGITILKLEGCPPGPTCRPEIPPVPNEVPTRRPTRLKTFIDGEGDTVLWFVEAGTSNLGVLRVSEDGRELDQAHFPCGCFAAGSLDLGPDGSVWFPQVVENRIGRLRPDVTRPYSPSAAQLDHYKIPSQTLVPSPPLFPNLMTSLPLSIAVDGRGRVWFSESSMSSVAYLEPRNAVPNTSQGFTELERPHSDFRSPAAPADVAVDRANDLWWAGEYGDQIEQIRPDDSTGHRFRSSVRRGLTEGPITDSNGNLWVVETGGNLITRISGVTTGPLVPHGLPAAFEADTTRNTLTGARLRDTSSVSVRVVRGGSVAASADVPVHDGRFTITAPNWHGATDRLRADDTVHIQPHAAFARAELSFRVASLSAEVRPDGSLAGRAMSAGQALGDRVHATFEGGSGKSGIDGADGAWSVKPGTRLGRSASGAVSWSWATVAGSFRTVTRFGPEAGKPSGVDPALALALARALRECSRHHWLAGSARKPTLPLVGLTRAQLRSCLGPPTARAAAHRKRPERWRYGRGTSVTFRAGRVAAFTLLDRRLRSARGDVGVGSPVKRLGKVMRGVRRDLRAHAHRALVAQGRGRYADVRVRTTRRGRIRRIDVSVKKRSQLDRFGRQLLRRRA